ncbi:hypothetical protein, partial [Klebsiella pneumoniae]
MLLPKELSQLVKEFGSVLLRGFAPLADAEQLQTWYLNHRSAVTWAYEVSVQAFKGSAGEQPLHWELSCPPAYMAVHPHRYQYEDYTPHEYAVYSVASPDSNTWTV